MSKANVDVTDAANTGELDDDQLDTVAGGSVNRIDPTPARIGTNLTIPRQTAKAGFGDRMNAGLETAAGLVANGAAVVGGMIPGGAIVSSAVSSVGSLAGSTNDDVYG